MNNNVENELNRELLDFIEKSPNAYFAVKNLSVMLENNGYTRLYEEDKWELADNKCYYVVRDDSSIIAFCIPKRTRTAFGEIETGDTVSSDHNDSNDHDKSGKGECGEDYIGFHIIASHSDSPAFKIKPNAEITVENSYIKLNTEKYGGMIMSTWLDRPLSIAGRVVVNTESGVETRLINIDRELCMIPSLAIHMDRKTNDGYVWNAQRDMLPLFAQINPDSDEDNLSADKNHLAGLIAREAGVEEEDILDTDLFLYNRSRGTLYGANNEFIGSPRLDDLQCAFAAMKGLVEGFSEDKKKGCYNTSAIPMCCVFNNEEVGSATKQGAASSFLEDVIARINNAFGKDEEEIRRLYANSFLISADNAHAVHPNHTDKADPTNRPMLNKGIVIKYNANQKYTTDAVSGGILRKMCSELDVPVQTYVNRSDIAGGSTLGNIATTRVSVNAVDIGLAQLAMHSAYETAGALDTYYLKVLANNFYYYYIRKRGEWEYIVQ